MRERDYHQKQAHKTNSEYHWQHFRQLRNHVNNQVTLAKSKSFQDSVNSNKDKPSDLWKTLNELTSRNKSGTTPSCIISEEMPIADQKSIASILNEYFTSIGSKLANKIRSTSQPKQLPPSTDHLSFSFEFEEVDESSLKTNKATGLDQISAKLLKDSASTIASSLTKTFNASLARSSHKPSQIFGKKGKLFLSSNPMIQYNLTTTDLSLSYPS